MAKVKVKTKTSKKIVLKLSEDEAEIILALCGAVAGPRENTPREFTDSIYDCLCSVTTGKYTDNLDNTTIYFRTKT